MMGKVLIYSYASFYLYITFEKSLDYLDTGSRLSFFLYAYFLNIIMLTFTPNTNNFILNV